MTRHKCKCGKGYEFKTARKVLRCHHCGKLGHIEQNCRELGGEKSSQKEKRGSNHKANKSTSKRQLSNGESAELVVSADHVT